MAFTLKHQKEIESDTHEQLYTNLLILTMEYPTTKEFNSCFKKDMFVKNNKAAFQHIVHFLLDVLDPQFFRQKHIWPILDAKMETQFRNEVMRYVNELNATNKETGIPLLMTSHLISPGGYKFTDFVFRLSQYVLAEHLKRNNKSHSHIIFPPKADNEYDISSEQVKNLNSIVDKQYITLVQKQKAFVLKYTHAKEKAKYLTEQKPIVEKSIVDTEEKINEFIKLSEIECADVCENLGATKVERDTEIDRKIDQLNNNMLRLQECSKLLEILHENKNLFTQDMDTEMDNKQDLIVYFKSFLELLKNNKHLIKDRKDVHLPEHIQISRQIYEELDECCTKYEELVSEMQNYAIHLDEMICNNSNSDCFKIDSLSQIIHKILEPVSSINIYTQS